MQGLRDANWEIGEDVLVMRRGGAAGADRWRSAARELVGLDLVLVSRRQDSLDSVAAGRQPNLLNKLRPVFLSFDFERDPIGSGFVKSLSRPGGNVTGFFCDFSEGMTRLATALQDAVPTVRQVVALTDGESTEIQARTLRDAAGALGLEVSTLDVGAAAPDALIDRLAAWRATFVVLASPRLESEATRLAKRALRRRLASAGAFIRYAHAGGLLSRGPSLPDAFRRAAATVDRLLRGARAADIAVERPPRFELVVNLRTAAALELRLSPALMSSADHIVR